MEYTDDGYLCSGDEVKNSEQQNRIAHRCAMRCLYWEIRSLPIRLSPIIGENPRTYWRQFSGLLTVGIGDYEDTICETYALHVI
jgi:hypothetical protein